MSLRQNLQIQHDNSNENKTNKVDTVPRHATAQSFILPNLMDKSKTLLSIINIKPQSGWY